MTERGTGRSRPPTPWASMRLSNFRGFEDTGEIHFSPITLFFGKNNSGKTTLLRAPLLLRQLVRHRLRDGEVPLSGLGVDFGTYRDLVFRGELRRDVTLSFTFNSSATRILRSVVEGTPLEGLTEAYRMDVQLHWNIRNSRTQVQSIGFFVPDAAEPSVLIERLSPNRTRVKVPVLSLTTTFENVPELGLNTLQFLRPRRLSNPQRSDEVPELRIVDLLFYGLSQQLEDGISHVTHIGPLRQMPERAYRLDRVSATAEASESIEMVDLMARRTDTAKSASRSLRQLGIPADVEVVRPAAGYVGIVLRDERSGRRTNLADMGFGVSQVLPILVTLSSLPARSVVLIEQPELHLHPDTQGALADVLLEFSRRRNLMLVIESHSEHILLRLQRRIAARELAPEDVAVYVVDQGRVSRSDIDALGRLDSAVLPEGFFEEEWHDAIALAKAAATEGKNA